MARKKFTARRRDKSERGEEDRRRRFRWREKCDSCHIKRALHVDTTVAEYLRSRRDGNWTGSSSRSPRSQMRRERESIRARAFIVARRDVLRELSSAPAQ